MERRRFTGTLGESGDGGRTYLGLRAEIRRAAGIEDGDSVDVVLELDDERVRQP